MTRRPRSAKHLSSRPPRLHVCLQTLGALSATLVSIAVFAPPALAVPEKPPTAQSYYVVSGNAEDAFKEGCLQGESDRKTNTDSNVILDFGGQLGNLSGTEAIDKTDFKTSQIEAIAEEFGAGYLSCTLTDTTTTVRIGIGTNSSKEAVSTAGGKAWAELVKTVAAHILESEAAAKQVAIWGADDLEVGFSTGTAALAWAKSYSKHTESPYQDYGDAAGCPETTHTNGKCTGGKSGWNQTVEAELNWRIANAWSTPEIYYNPPPGTPANAKEWVQIMLWDQEHFTTLREMEPQGPLDQGGFEGSNSSSQAWQEFEEQIESSGLTGSQAIMYYSLTI
jgi:hypothetical protein